MRGPLIPLLLSLTGGPAVPPGTQTYANPIDIDYRYNWEQANQGISYRTGADPAIVNHNGVYYLFETLADGYWRSTDLVHWTFVTPSRWPFNGMVAPAVLSDAKRLYILQATMEPTAILTSTTPDTGKLDFYTRRMPELPGAVRPGQEEHLKPGQIPPGPWDPALFKDDDERWYLYWNSSNVYPLYGIELDPKNKLAYIGQAKPMLALHPDEHGWERFGQDHSGTLPDGTPIKPFVEGAWMTKIGARYYLQYGAPGTEYNAYANGSYVGDKPLGPFIYAPWNPIAYKPGGFVQGPGMARPLSIASAICGIVERRGSAITGHSNGASTCFPAELGAMGSLAFPPVSGIFRTMCRNGRSMIRRACLPAGCSCLIASLSLPHPPSALMAPPM